MQSLFAAHDMKRGAALAAGFGQDEGAGREIEGGERLPAGEFGLRGTPVEAAGDHEVQDEPEIAVDANGDALADAAQGADGAAFGAESGGSTVRRTKMLARRTARAAGRGCGLRGR